MSRWAKAAAIALVMAAPFACLQAVVNSGGAAPGWARAWNGFRLADEARGRLSGDTENPDAGVAIGSGAVELAKEAYRREPLASNAVFVLALAESPSAGEYKAGPVAKLGATLDKRNALLELLLIADAAQRQNYRAMFDHADVLAAAHPELARTVLAPLFDQLGDPAAVPIVGTALRNEARWGEAFQSYVPRDEAALRNYLTLRHQAPAGSHWKSDEQLVAVLAQNKMYDEAFAMWRLAAGEQGDQYGFVTGDEYAPIGWRLVTRGDRVAQVGADGEMSVSVERGAGGEVARQLVVLPVGRYRLEATIKFTGLEAPLWIALSCASGGMEMRQPLRPQADLTARDGNCPAYWLIVGASALESRHGIDATLSDWRLSKLN